MSGPGTANFLDANSPSTTVSFTLAGSYTLRLTAFDGATSAMEMVNSLYLLWQPLAILTDLFDPVSTFNDPTIPTRAPLLA